jgi:AraC-like DNA-binding protein
LEIASYGTTDPLIAIIPLLRPQAVLSKIISGVGSWSIRKPSYNDPAFCLVLEGSCFLTPDGVDALELRRGDFVLLPETPSFTLASDPAARPELLPFNYDRETHYGDADTAPTMRMLGGFFRFDRANSQLLTRMLPAVVVVRRDDAGGGRLRRIVELIGDEANASRPGQDAILERLTEVLLIEALRCWSLRPSKEERGLLAGLADPSLSKALREIHGDISRKWTVAQLARCACMSRAVFADRFARTIGIPPMQYIVEWRIATAKAILRREQRPLAAIAARVGYQSVSAFSTAFTRVTGSAPSDYIRIAR